MEDLANYFKSARLMWLAGVHGGSLQSTALISIAFLFAASVHSRATESQRWRNEIYLRLFPPRRTRTELSNRLCPVAMAMARFVLLCWRDIRSLPLRAGSPLSIFPSPRQRQAQTLAQRAHLSAARYVVIDDDLLKTNP